jgi:hypothetical protein
MSGQRPRGVWVVRRGKGFIVRVPGSRFPRGLGATRRAATMYARSLARAYQCELVVQNRHGRIRIKDSHGHDPSPPRG